MNRKKTDLDPIQLIIIGLCIMLFGTYVVAKYVSTIGGGIFVIAGLFLWIVAIVKLLKRITKTRTKASLIWLPVFIASLAIIGVGLYSYQIFRNRANSKIYVAGDTVKLSDFSILVEDVKFNDVSIVIPQDKEAKFGGLATVENCSQYPYLSWEKNGVDISSLDYNENEYEKKNPSGRFCEWRNESRIKINKYKADNKRLSLNYQITAKNTVDSSKISISLLPDTGRNVAEPAKQFDFDPLLSKRYSPAFDFTYTPYSASKIGGDINTGITRKGTIEADIRNGENTIDFKIVYQRDGSSVERIIRLQR